MRGFDETYTDIVDYIVRVTHRIWEDQDVGYIYDTYRPACRVYTDAGPQYGVESVVEHTMQAINAFPDVRHIADDIIWAGNEDEGFATSHRAINVGHHLGPWRWGSATGRKIQLWVIANCVSEENQIFEEWVLHNAGARLAQCGIDVRAAARIYGNSGLSLPLGEREITEVERLQGGRIPTRLAEPSADSDDIELVVRALFHNAYNRRDLSAIDRVYAPNVRWHGPTNREGYGRAEVRGMARALMATFPDLGLHVDEVYWMGNPAEGHAVSVRWTAIGTHRGFGLYGEPTGRRVHLWGLSQLYFAGGQIVEDWSLFNEFDVFAQILRDEPTELEPIRG
ncbi:MAG: ester cyclase [Solirubrobacterales bacterium]|nr:ester cyclase [Solirubrobacterales bacterium]